MRNIGRVNMGFFHDTRDCNCNLCNYYREKKVRIAVYHPKTSILNNSYTCKINTQNGGTYGK